MTLSLEALLYWIRCLSSKMKKSSLSPRTFHSLRKIILKIQMKFKLWFMPSPILNSNQTSYILLEIQAQMKISNRALSPSPRPYRVSPGGSLQLIISLSKRSQIYSQLMPQNQRQNKIKLLKNRKSKPNTQSLKKLFNK